MNRDFYLNLAARGLRMPVGADLVLTERSDAEEIRRNGEQLGKVIAEAARRYQTPLAFPLMDLTIEKERLLTPLGVTGGAAAAWHFSDNPKDTLEELRTGLSAPPTAKMLTTSGALRYIAEQTELVPVGMSIGPFSLTTKLLADPITPIFASGSGVSGEDDESVYVLEQALEIARQVIELSLKLQFEAGAKAVFICEPAASTAFISPRQLKKGSDVFDRLVMAPNLKLRSLLREADVDLIFHDCGELTDEMVGKFADLEPAILSLGSSRTLWQDAALLPKSIVLYGNLPTKRFYSDSLVTVEQAGAMASELVAKMRETGHPFILGSECDVLSVPGSEVAIRAKVQAFLQASS